MSRDTIFKLTSPTGNAAVTTTSGNTAIAINSKNTRFAPDNDVFIKTGPANVSVTVATGIKLFGGIPEYVDTSDGYFAVITALGTATVNYTAAVEM